MIRSGESRAALAVMAAVAGTGYASGRELTLFFAQLGWASWVSVALSAVFFALMIWLSARCAEGAGEGFAAALRRPKPGAGRALNLLRALLLALTAAVMLLGAARLGALALPVARGALWGAGIALALALLINLGALRALPWLGMTALGAGAAFYAALAVDPRPVRTYLAADAELALEGSLPAAALLALLYAALNAAVAGFVVARFAGACPHRGWLGARCGALLALVLLCANAALERGGRALLGQALPVVLLAARWGLPGFWMCTAFGFLCIVCTLSAALGGLIDLLRNDYVKC